MILFVMGNMNHGKESYRIHITGLARRVAMVIRAINVKSNVDNGTRSERGGKYSQDALLLHSHRNY
jgi:hypothetical protein